MRKGHSRNPTHARRTKRNDIVSQDCGVRIAVNATADGETTLTPGNCVVDQCRQANRSRKNPSCIAATHIFHNEVIGDFNGLPGYAPDTAAAHGAELSFQGISCDMVVLNFGIHAVTSNPAAPSEQEAAGGSGEVGLDSIRRNDRRSAAAKNPASVVGRL